MPVLERIVEQHAEEAAFFWLARDRAASAPDENLASLARLDGRIEAHLEGLAVAGDKGWRLCSAPLEEATADAGEVFVAACMVLTEHEPERLGVVLSAAADPIAARGVASALGWLPLDRTLVELLLAESEPPSRRLGVSAFALHRREFGGALERALSDPDLAVRERALVAAGEMGRDDLLPPVIAALADDDAACRLAAAHAAALLGAQRAAIPTLVEAAEGGAPGAESACRAAARSLPLAEAVRWLRGLAEIPASLRLAVSGVAVAGDPAQVPWLIERMSEPEVARGAGEAVSWITGLDFPAAGLVASPPAGFNPGPNGDPADEAVDLDTDEGLPWPDADGLASWWLTEGEQWTPGVRHLGGHPVASGPLSDVLRSGSQRMRQAAAIELALLEPSREVFETRAPGARQLAQLGPEEG